MSLHTLDPNPPEPAALRHATLDPRTAEVFPIAARAVLGDSQLRKNLRHVTHVIQTRRQIFVEEWQRRPEVDGR